MPFARNRGCLDQPAATPRPSSPVAGTYQRRRPEETTLYRTLAHNWRAFLATMDGETDGAGLPGFVVAEVDAFLRCGILAHGFVRLACEACRAARLVAFSCKRRGFCPACIGRRMSERAAHLVDAVLPCVPVRQWVLTVPHGLRYRMAHDPSLTTKLLNVFVRAISNWLKRRARKLRIAGTLKTGAVTVIQRFDSALALNVHFHTVALDGVYALDPRAQPVFHPTPPPTDAEVAALATAIYRKVYALVDYQGWGSEPASALAACTSASITRFAATGPRRGSPLRRIIGDKPPPARIVGRRCAQIEGFNLHANTRVAANERDQLENVCRYLARPPLSDERLTSLPDGNLALRLKRPWSDGTTHLILSPSELIERLIPLVPRPRAHLTRYHGVLAPAAGWRSQVVPAPTVARKLPPCAGASRKERFPAARKWTPWAELLRRVF